ncbi:MAG TPA: radical SAM family heme chaperone HemW [Candidatus Binatia bacterium]|nr:radical SAM family heme chaperone HemW [Candidatus Binatia bacterium]
MPADRVSLYVHIPYCIRKCPYCDFNSHVVAEIPEQAYVEALVREIDYYAGLADWSERRVQSIFFGGGTPSTFHCTSIGSILDRVAGRFQILPDCEITLEANPGTVDRGNFFGYREAGINRISVGVQSFQPRLLKLLGRAHSAEEARKALVTVREAGFENFSLDLIYANPDQTIWELADDLENALSFRSPHLSAYNLTIEEGTPFYHEFRSGRMRPLSEEDEVAMADLIEQRFREAGLERYEISNYARPGFRSRHNLNYWQGGDYLGLGAGAHSYRRNRGNVIGGHRWSNEKNPARYMSKIEASGNAVIEREEGDLRKTAGEFMFSGLRLIDGIALDAFFARFGKSPREFYPQISEWLSDGLMETDGARIWLTRRGLMVANSMFVDFV